MADEVDLAQERIEAEREARLRAAAQARAEAMAEGQAVQEECASCGDVIPPARRQAAPWACRCVDCENAFERDKRKK